MKTSSKLFIMGAWGPNAADWQAWWATVPGGLRVEATAELLSVHTRIHDPPRKVVSSPNTDPVVLSHV